MNNPRWRLCLIVLRSTQLIQPGKGYGLEVAR